MAKSIQQQFTDLFDVWINTVNKQPTAGAETWAYARQMLPLLDWKGPGEIVQRNMVIYQPQVYVMQQVVPTGVAGIAAGQVAAAMLNQSIADMQANAGT